MGLAQLIRFLVVELTHSVQILDLAWMLYLRLIILLVGDNIFINDDALLVTDFMNQVNSIFWMCS
jgi:hypothetical protein